MSTGQSMARVGAAGRFRAWRRRRTIEAGHALTRAIAHLQAAQSLVGDPPIVDAGRFGFVAPLEAEWRAIRDEALEILRYRTAIPLFEEVSTDQKGISRGNIWRTFFLWGFGEPVAGACRRAPKTAALLAAVPNLQTAFLSILEPGSHIPPHRGLTKGPLTCHLGLIVPADRDNCRIHIDDRVQHWEEGRIFVFDDTRRHEVWNMTGEMRVVLLFHVDRPMRGLGRALHRLFLALVKRSAYAREPKARLGRFADRFEAAVRRSQAMLENAGRG